MGTLLYKLRRKMWRLFLATCLMMLLAVSSTRAEKEAECSPEELRGVCPRTYRPVCASDNVTYGNKCLLCAANSRMGPDRAKWRRIIRDGECEEQDRILL